ncbi:MAG: DUF5658 family protein [Acidobacteria bacterium]|nr:DUF5658 family protein [Acidobacteriota bacterium]
MSHRTLAAAVVVLTLVSPLAAREVRAQDRVPVRGQAQAVEPVTLLGEVPGVEEAQAVSASSGQLSMPIQQQVAPGTARPRSGGMLALYASTVAMQALDMHSTLTGFKQGAVESNALMGGITKNRAAFFAVKAAVATGTIIAAQRIAKRNKVAAVAMLVAVNSVYAFVVVHNYKVASGLR